MAQAEQTDEEIALLVQSHKVELFGILINRYEKKMTRYAGRVLNNKEDIQDVVQEIFTKAYININSFDVKRKFSSWLYKIAHNEIVNVFKKNKRRYSLPLLNLDIFFPQYAKDSTQDIGREMDRKETKAMIDSCFDTLENKYKEPIALYYLEELSYQEIADIMQIPTSTVGVRIKRAKKIMKQILETHQELGK